MWNTDADIPSASLLYTMNLVRNIWRQLKHTYSLQSEASLLTAFLYNPKLPDSLTYQMISPWLQRNLFHHGHIVNPVTRVLLSFADLREKHDLPRSAFFGYLQTRHYALTFTSNLQFSKLSPFECLVLSGPSQKGLTSDIYKLLNSHNMDSQGKHGYMLNWEKALGEEISPEQWQSIWSAKSSICILYKENTYKVLFSWYMTPSHLHAIYPTALDRCWRCLRDRGTLLHVYWQCPSLQPYWRSVWDLLQWLFEMDVPLHSKLYLLRLLPPKLSKLAKKLANQILTAASCLIVLNWKKRTPPALTDFYARIKDVEVMESFTAQLADRVDHHNAILEYWYLRIDHLRFLKPFFCPKGGDLRRVA